ncbi:MAG: hypothetical protein V4807_12240 [Burkholderia gladioli]|uniref:hypothetical protein n=1 Tax=Burkholderia gladioli TaxID=28095 RepID=UPI00285F533E|nr:hypothetical protein [Burkholderia gladioli]MDR8091093.1 hypothetical protein [Burkholderia gladioli]
MATNIDDIVDVVISIQNAPIATDLQRQAVLISQGGTTLTPGTTQLVASTKDVTALVAQPLSIASIQWATGTVTVTVTGTISLPVGQTAQYTVAGVSPAAYNGNFTVTGVSSNSFSYSLGLNPGTASTLGTVTPSSVFDIQSMGNSFFAGGAAVAATVLELGAGSDANAVAAFTTFLQSNPGQFYYFVVPRSWAVSTTFSALLSQYDASLAMTYFVVTATRANAATVLPTLSGHKCALAYIESDEDLATQSVYGAAAVAYSVVSQNPTSTRKLLPIAPRTIVGVQPSKWTSVERTLFQKYFANYPDVGLEAGLTNTLLKGNTYASGDYFEFWYASDRTVLNEHLALANAVVNGNANAINPLKFDQRGIDRLQQTAQVTHDNLVAAGVLLPSNQTTGTGIVNAVDFATYTAQNPSDYRQGIYRGLSLTVIPARGFSHVTFNLAVTDIVAAQA